MSSIPEIDFECVEIKSLPDWWRMKIEGGDWRSGRLEPRCPYDGGALVEMKKPIEHKHCLKCGRNYA